MKDLIKLRDFRLLWAGQATSYFGDGLTSLALLIVTQRLTGSVFAVATTAVAIALPQLLFGLAAGVYVDRWNRKTVMIVSDVVRGVLVLGFLLVDDPDRMWLLYSLAFTQAAVGTFFSPAKMAFLPAVVGTERLLAANSVGETTRIVAMLMGTTVAGVFAGLGELLWIVFVIDGVTFIVSALLELRITTDGRPRSRPGQMRFWSELGTGLRTAVTSRVLVAVMVSAAVLMFGLGAVNVLLVPFVVDDLQISEAWFGPLEASQVAGMVMAGALLAVFAARVRPTATLTVGLVALGTAVAAFALIGEVWHILLALFIVGWFVAPIQASVTTLVQSEVSDDQRARIGSVFSTVVTSASVASMALAGAAAAWIGVRGVFVLAGAIAVSSGLLAAVLFRMGRRPLAAVPSDDVADAGAKVPAVP